MLKKIICTVAGTALLVSISSASVFAATQKDLKTTNEEIKTTNSARLQSLKDLKETTSSKLSSLGVVKLTDEQKAQVKTLRDQLKSLKDQKATLKTQLKAASDAKDTEKVKTLKDQIKALNTQILDKLKEIQAITGGKNPNAAKVKEVRSTVKNARNEKKPLIEAEKANNSEIKSLKEQLKSAIAAKDKEKAASIRDQIISKLNIKKDNLEKRTNINKETAQIVSND